MEEGKEKRKPQEPKKMSNRKWSGTNKRSIGAIMEERAVGYLAEQGMQILERLSLQAGRDRPDRMGERVSGICGSKVSLRQESRSPRGGSRLAEGTKNMQDSGLLPEYA